MITRSYRAARSTILDGDLIFVRNGTSLTSKTIQTVTKSIYSHVGIAFSTTIADKSRLMIVEAQGGTARRIINMSFYENDSLDVVRAPRPWLEYADEALESVGRIKYGWMEAAYVGIREGALKHFSWKLPFKDFSGEICSEFAARMVGIETHHVSPQGLMDILNERGHQIALQIR